MRRLWSGTMIAALVLSLGPPVDMLLPAMPARADVIGDPNTFGSVLRARGCGGKVYVRTPHGVSELIWVGGSDVEIDDVLNGNLERTGQFTLTDRSNGKTVTVVIVDDLLSDSEFASRVRRFCK